MTLLQEPITREELITLAENTFGDILIILHEMFWTG